MREWTGFTGHFFTREKGETLENAAEKALAFWKARNAQEATHAFVSAWLGNVPETLAGLPVYRVKVKSSAIVGVGILETHSTETQPG